MNNKKVAIMDITQGMKLGRFRVLDPIVRFSRRPVNDDLNHVIHVDVIILRCQCGTRLEMEVDKLGEIGEEDSCGCLSGKRNKPSRLTHPKEYMAWNAKRKTGFTWPRFTLFLRDIGVAPHSSAMLLNHEACLPSSAMNTYWHIPVHLNNRLWRKMRFTAKEEGVPFHEPWNDIMTFNEFITSLPDGKGKIRRKVLKAGFVPDNLYKC